MSPITHFFTGWLVANIPTGLGRRERALVALAGVVHDVDGLGLVAELLTRDTARPLLWWTEYHYVLGHNLLFGALASAIAVVLSKRRRRLTGLLAFISFHLHVLGDLIGARGPDGDQWPIHYLYPFVGKGLTWAGQWELNAWPNFLLTGFALLLTFLLARRRGYSPIEMFSMRADRAFVETLRQRFPV
jgi:inner membrane protein